MIMEIIIFFSIILIFLILAKKLPDVKNEVILKLAKIDDYKQKNDDISVKTEKISQDENIFDQAENFFQKGDYEKAEKIYIKLITLKNFDNIKIYNRLGIIYLNQNNFLDAKEAFSESIKNGGETAARYYNLALSCYGLKEFSNANEAINKALVMDKDNSKYLSLKKQIKAKINRRIFK